MFVSIQASSFATGARAPVRDEGLLCCVDWRMIKDNAIANAPKNQDDLAVRARERQPQWHCLSLKGTVVKMENERLTVTVSTIYSLSMPKYLYVQMYGKDAAIPSPLRIKADKIEEKDGKWVFSLANQPIGQMWTGAVAGWWIQDED